MEKRKIKKTAALLAALACAVLTTEGLSAQTVQIVHDSQKLKQWQSMENGSWGFAPDAYYHFFHHDYSGSYETWEWHGFKSGWRIHFSEDRSNVKRIMPTRILEEEVQRQRLTKAREEREHAEAMNKEELQLQADRLIDVVYSDYSDDFNHMQDVIADGLLYCLERSNGTLAPAINRIKRENEVICANVAYIHKTGAGYELENAKRQKAYEAQREAMRELVRQTAKLTQVANAYFTKIEKNIDGNNTVLNGSASH